MDPIADMLVIIKNGYLSKKASVVVPLSKSKLAIVKILEREKFVKKVNADKSNITVELLYAHQKGAISEIKRISKLGRRVYFKSKQIKPVKGGKGMIVVSTYSGLMTGKEAKEKNLGGEVICQVW